MYAGRRQGYTEGMRNWLIVFSILGLASSLALAEQTYRWVDENGNMVFSDQPPPPGVQGEAVDIPPASVVETYKPPRTDAAEPATDEATADADKPVRYSSLSIVSPENDATIRENAGNVSIVVESRPALQPGHRLRLYLDGVLLQDSEKLSANLTNVDRGTHTIRAEIVDGSGKVLRKATSQFHLLRHSINQATPATP